MSRITRQIFYWFDLEGDLKFGHRCLYVFVDQARGRNGVGAVVAHRDLAVTAPSLEFLGQPCPRRYYPGVRPLTNLAPAKVSQAKPKIIAPSSAASLTGKAALLLGGKAESATEFSTWQHDLDSVRATLIYGNPPAVDSNKVIVENDVTYATFYSHLEELANCDTLYLFFTGHGDASAGGGIVLNDIGGRTVLPYSLLSELLFDSLNLKRLYTLIDASNAGRAIDDFMRTTGRSSTSSLPPALTCRIRSSGGTQSTLYEGVETNSVLSPWPRGEPELAPPQQRLRQYITRVARNPPDTTNALLSPR